MEEDEAWTVTDVVVLAPCIPPVSNGCTRGRGHRHSAILRGHPGQERARAPEGLQEPTCSAKPPEPSTAQGGPVDSGPAVVESTSVTRSCGRVQPAFDQVLRLPALGSSGAPNQSTSIDVRGARGPHVRPENLETSPGYEETHMSGI